MIGILDIGMGNLKSVSSSVYILGYDPLLVTQASQLDDCTHLWIPGVGMYSTASLRLQNSGLIGPIRAFVDSGRPVMGTCLGMQILSTNGQEGGQHAGLDLIPGNVARLRPGDKERLPHMGWNEVHKRKDHPIFQDIKQGIDFYFVHSYHFVVEDQNSILAVCPYAGEFTCAVGANNVIGTQFHPEKSQKNGLTMVGNFCNWDGRC